MIREKLCCKIVGYFKTPSVDENVKKAVVQVAFPSRTFTKNLIKKFKEPKFGIECTRKSN